jgi:uncharacterized BrkB/YihY/UPF0761 family membrane protein
MFALGSFVLAAVFLAFAYFSGDDDNSTRSYLIGLLIVGAATAIVFWLAPRFLPQPDTPALVLAVLAAVAVVVFWLGLTPVFAGAAAYLVLGPPAVGVSEEPARRSGRRNAALGLASLATLAFAIACVVG